MARKLGLTPAAVDELTDGSRADRVTPGLFIDVLSSGKKRWRYRRQVAGTKAVATVFGNLFPAQSIAAAREWARRLNEQVEAGIDPRVARREEQARAAMTVGKAHRLYMAAVREGRSSRAKRPNKPRTIKDKLEIYQRDIAPQLADRCIYEVSESDLIRLVEAKGRVAKIRANRLAAELRVFFGWAASLRGLEIGLPTDPARRLGDLRFPEAPRSRKLSLLELDWFLKAVAEEPRHFQRGMLLCLLTAARISEVARARTAEVSEGVWTIPASRSKNSQAHRIALGPWGRSLMRSSAEWIFPAPKLAGPRNNSVWYKARDRVLARMASIAGHEIEHFTPHDLRRTARSNTKRLNVDYDTAEAMLNHVKKGLERTYDLYDLEEEKRSAFLRWELEVAALAMRAGVAEALGVPELQPTAMPPISANALPQRAGVEPTLHLCSFKPRATPMFTQSTAKIVFPRKP